MTSQTQPSSPEALPSPEDDPLFLTEEERERILKLTDQFSGTQAVKMVLKGERLRRYVAAEARRSIERSSNEAQEERRVREDESAGQRDEDLIKLLRETYPPKINPPVESDDRAA